MALQKTLTLYYRSLSRHFGFQHWWPAETPFEVMVGAILTQNTAWGNVEQAIANLKSAGLLDPRRMLDAGDGLLASAIRPAGYFRVKTKRLKNYLRWFVQEYDGDVARMKRVPAPQLREQLLEVNGIGPETADSILLYAVGVPTFVVDAYTHRILQRHNLAPEESSYEELKEMFESNLPRDVALFNDFHAQIVAVGKSFCRPKPRCEKCPLREHLPK